MTTDTVYKWTNILEAAAKIMDRTSYGTDEYNEARKIRDTAMAQYRITVKERDQLRAHLSGGKVE